MSDEVQRITIQLRPPKGNDPGKIAEGWYVIDPDNCVRLTDQAGKSLGSEKHHLGSSGDARLIACRMLRRHQNASGPRASFSGPIQYPKGY